MKLAVMFVKCGDFEFKIGGHDVCEPKVNGPKARKTLPEWPCTQFERSRYQAAWYQLRKGNSETGSERMVNHPSGHLRTTATLGALRVC